MKKNDKLVRFVETSVLSSLAVVLMLTIRFWLLPGAKFLEYDMGDVPVITATLLLGPGAGTAVLLFVSLIQSLTVSAASSWQGFVMHFVSSEIFLLTVSFIVRRSISRKKLFGGFAAGTVLMAAVMVPLNLIFTPMYMGVPVQAVIELLLPAIIPFNLFKGFINSLIVFLLYFPLQKILTKSDLLPKKKTKSLD